MREEVAQTALVRLEDSRRGEVESTDPELEEGFVVPPPQEPARVTASEGVPTGNGPGTPVLRTPDAPSQGQMGRWFSVTPCFSRVSALWEPGAPWGRGWAGEVETRQCRTQEAQVRPLTSLQAELWALADGLSSLGTHRAITGGLVPAGARALAACGSPPVRLQASS